MRLTGERLLHQGGGDVARPFIGIGGTFLLFALPPRLLGAGEMAVGGERGPRHGDVLAVQLDGEREVIGMQPQKAHDIFGLSTGDDALRGEIGLISVDR
ncbi:MAG TPA: hypothetical protein DDZ81_06400 [Acetobacteraceae bacterium]|nr:hypothetical protein [Acetobacteraceae bacterium]